ncbi:MAG: MYG1 family protein [Ruminococcus sp.]|nr:MYG1 family protein [Ruminococcus sp.]
MIKITKNINEATAITHAGNFHADDVFGTVFLDKYWGDITVIRLKEYHDNGSVMAYDIGLGEFDHHGRDYDKKRPNGIHYCGFGLLYQKFGLDYLRKINVPDPEATFKVFDYLLVNMIDAIDNGELSVETDYNVYTLSSLIHLYRPKFNENKEEDECFLDATNFASTIFDLVLKDAVSKVEAINIIKDTPIKDKVLVLDEFLPYEFAIFNLNLDVDFVVYPSNRGGYAAHTVPTFYRGFTPKIPFKDDWGGLKDEALQEVSGIKTARFCHKNLFLFTADTKEDALKAIELSLI